MKIKLTNARVERLINAIKTLEKPNANGKPNDYKDRQAQVLYNLTRSLRAAEDSAKDVFDARNKLVQSLLPPGTTELTGELQNKFVIQFQEVLDAEIEIEVRRVKMSHLHIDANKLAPDVLSGLSPILIDDMDAEFPDE